MFNENLKALRKERGFSQEGLAERLHVVRQTVSKWEKGLSVPDAELLISLSEIFEVSVSTLLGDTVEVSADKNLIAQKLEQLNALLAEKNRRSCRIWKVIAGILIALVVVTALLMILNISTSQSLSIQHETNQIEQTITP